MIPWSFFSSVVTQSGTSFINNEGLIKKIYLPKVIFPLSIAYAYLIDSALAFHVLFAIIIIIGGSLSWAVLFIPIAYLMLFLFALGIGLITSVATVFFRDLQHVILIAMQGLFFLTPILYKHDALAVGDGAMGFWAAMEEMFPQTGHQRCWFHKMGNVLNALPKSQHARAKTDMQAIWMAATRDEAQGALAKFVETYRGKYPKAVEKLEKDRGRLLAFYDFPAEHWQHIRTTNPIESTFATVWHRTTRTRNCVSRATFLGLAFKLIEEAEKSWRRIRGADKIELLLKGIAFKDGEPVQDDPPVQQKVAA